MSTIQPKNLITIKEASLLLGVTPLTLRNWDKSGKLKALRHPLNNYRVYKKSDIDSLLLSMESGAAPVYVPKRKREKKLSVRHE
ncbi:MAG: MerR family DNA-binding transcriptional regulator [Candidatus Paceibacterota bacterium]|jgi:site-specific DNA-methyltransferase (adenine-specific)